jgi:hypothetical protein
MRRSGFSCEKHEGLSPNSYRSGPAEPKLLSCPLSGVEVIVIRIWPGTVSLGDSDKDINRGQEPDSGVDSERLHWTGLFDHEGQD